MGLPEVCSEYMACVCVCLYVGFSSHSLSLCAAQGPCHIELHAALDVITSSQQKLGDKFTTFYLPNCDKHGFYKAKQVGIFTSLSHCEIDSTCWSSWSYWCQWLMRSPIPVSHSVWVIPGRPSCPLLVCLCLEWEEDPGLERPAQWLRVSTRSHSLTYHEPWAHAQDAHAPTQTHAATSKHVSGNCVNPRASTGRADFLFRKIERKKTTHSFTQNVTSYSRGGKFLLVFIYFMYVSTLIYSLLVYSNYH